MFRHSHSCEICNAEILWPSRARVCSKACAAERKNNLQRQRRKEIQEQPKEESANYFNRRRELARASYARHAQEVNARNLQRRTASFGVGFKNVLIRLTTAEHAALRRHVADAGISLEKIVRDALAKAGLLGRE